MDDDDDFAELYGSAAEEPASTVKAPAAANGKGPDVKPAGHTQPVEQCPPSSAAAAAVAGRCLTHELHALLLLPCRSVWSTLLTASTTAG